jgi:SAM-dependent methyltransferase
MDEPSPPSCRFCGAVLEQSFADLGTSPLANAFLDEDDLAKPEVFYPLHAYVCGSCLLVQLAEYEPPERIFADYAYFSSYSDSWLDHAKQYAEHAVARFGLGSGSRIVEIASNDGYLLQYFRARGIPVLGVEPADTVADAAEAKGIPTLRRFFGREAAADMCAAGQTADLLIGNNVLAHVPDLNDFVAGLQVVLEPEGILTMEFPHLLRLIEEIQFDTIYHEHFSYFSLLTAERVFAAHELELFDVEELPTHGGSLRVYVRHADGEGPGERVAALRERELAAGLEDLDTYARFAERVRAAKRDLLGFLLDAARNGETVVAYGAAAKGTTLLNYCGAGRDLVAYVIDRSPHKQGRFVPGVRLSVEPPERVVETRPSYLLLLAWNLKDEIVDQMSHVRKFGCRFVTPVPTVEIHA